MSSHWCVLLLLVMLMCKGESTPSKKSSTSKIDEVVTSITKILNSEIENELEVNIKSTNRYNTLPGFDNGGVFMDWYQCATHLKLKGLRTVKSQEVENDGSSDKKVVRYHFINLKVNVIGGISKDGMLGATLKHTGENGIDLEIKEPTVTFTVLEKSGKVKINFEGDVLGNVKFNTKNEMHRLATLYSFNAPWITRQFYEKLHGTLSSKLTGSPTIEWELNSPGPKNAGNNFEQVCIGNAIGK